MMIVIEKVKMPLLLTNCLRREKFHMKLKVFTLPACPKCPAAKKIAKAVADKYGLEFFEVDINTPDGQLEGLMHQIMSTPSVAIDENVISRGDLISKEELDAEVRKRLDNETS